MKNIKGKKYKSAIPHVKNLVIKLIFKGYKMGASHFNK